MDVVNSFFGALLGVWMAVSFPEFVEGKQSWLFFPLVFTVAMTIFLLNKAIGVRGSEKFLYGGYALYLSFLSAILVEVGKEPTTFPQLNSFGTWFFLFIVLIWWAISELVRRNRRT